ncbi:ATPase/histidine kinase/DNA gyrase B/HSP90 domain protein [Marvinbryantia formatexigens DSM 14469]|uniref:ATPase/histidine kinase/DNA gyrase B/HSP90 domain protein n=1 Tax=Marvinbryantia formatexigens DSM 14469 TaxID=478749 RepID=C6LL34_9FIRM|nr:sensor histidine kinase [Marvinbryantia formatexigens]EET58653.1 ATPase/histidine kinase/DNA gyrase B/HSP90 domain protein [Marvinbryantia formatexigens DSM 14469]UWO23375.1 sensor histidine kinase [Marvinbryantia formatexigens DSM 14469]SDG39489.1 two-component system, sensor histidine kinase YesM [Marvinbryantia formatexigens]
MKQPGKLKYISSRVVCVALVYAAVAAALAAVQLYLMWKENPSPLPTVLLLCALAAALAVSWVWIVLPYRRCERMLQRLAEGYPFSDAKDFDDAALTPVMHSQLSLIEQSARSPQFMDLNKRQAQYLALQNQINPHFLYNTLESIRGEALIAGLDSVADMTEALAKFFRYTITKVENLVSVEEELDNCETYFGIQKYRFGDRLQLHIEYEPEEWSEIMNCRIPKLTLQPILENSIIHGTELKIGTGNLYICFARTQDRLLIRISDDGVGMDEETLTKLNRKLGKSAGPLASQEEEKQGGIALVNVNNRIHLIFGDEYGIHVYSVPQSGTDVEITLPIVTSDREIRNRDVLG